MIRGSPIGSQMIIGSLPSGFPRGPRPGRAAFQRCWAQGVIGGACALSEKLVPRTVRAHQIPERSRALYDGAWPIAASVKIKETRDTFFYSCCAGGLAGLA